MVSLKSVFSTSVSVPVTLFYLGFSEVANLPKAKVHESGGYVWVCRFYKWFFACPNLFLYHTYLLDADSVPKTHMLQKYLECPLGYNDWDACIAQPVFHFGNFGICLQYLSLASNGDHGKQPKALQNDIAATICKDYKMICQPFIHTCRPNDTASIGIVLLI